MARTLRLKAEVEVKVMMVAALVGEVIPCDRHFRRDNTHSGKATMCCSCIPLVSVQSRPELQGEMPEKGRVKGRCAPYVFAPDVATA